METEKLHISKDSEMPHESEQIYIVDDDESVRRSLSLMLKSFGFEVQTFASAAQFLNSVLRHAPGCLVLDVHMLGMDGFALQQKLNANGFRIPIIFISADEDLRLSGQYLKAAGAVGFLQKPFDDRALVDLVTIALEKSSLGKTGKVELRKQ